MKRRKAIIGIGLIGAGVGAFSGFKWYKWNKSPDLDYLKNQKELLAALVDTIIPQTDTPGAREAGVHDFVMTMVTDCIDIRSQNKFVDGLKDLQSYCIAEYDKPYQDCTESVQIEVMTHFESEGKPFKGIVGKAEKKFLGQSFFTTLKQYTSIGYCTSQMGATQALAYVPIPGKLIGCIDLEKGQKSWALE